MNLRCHLITLIFFAMTVGEKAYPQSPPSDALSKMMPRETDLTSMWWRDGFPGVIPDAAWRRIVKTGHYWFMLDTDSMNVARIGSASVPPGDLPSAELDLKIEVEGKSYRCKAGAVATRFGGPRLIESGRFLQRADVTNLVLTAEDGSKLNAEARFETAAWPDQLALRFSARPGRQPIKVGEGSFGRVRGGFGLDGSNEWEIPAADCDTPETFTLEFWVFLPNDYQAGQHAPWLVCKNPHEAAEGNYGLILQKGGVPEARINIGGGGGNSHTLRAESRHALNFDQWNHLAISYDGDLLQLYSNGHFIAESRIGKKRIPQPGGLTFGNRQDKLGDGAFRFRGIVDEIRLYDRALTLGELRQHFNQPEANRSALKPIKEWTFREDILMSPTLPSEKWKAASIEMRLANEKGELKSRWDLPKAPPWEAPDWHEATLMMDPVTFQSVAPRDKITIEATEIGSGAARPVTYDRSEGWHRVNLDGIEPVPPPGGQNPCNDAIERIKLVLSNPTDREEIARLMFEKTSRGIRQKIGTPITGISAILRDTEGNPTGIPVQLSKNWHLHPEERGVHSGQWFHGISQVRLPPGAKVELELTLAYGHWGGVAAASHAQLCLIGWGANQRWDQSALGAWGESICYEPEQIQGKCSITDVRPLMVKSKKDGAQWGWTNNVGGADFFRLFDPENQRVFHSGMRTDSHKQGPCLTEVTYTGGIGKTGIIPHSTVSLARSDDLIRATYQIGMRVTQPVDFSRFVIFQTAADTYATTREQKLAVGNRDGLVKEWNAQWGGNIYRGDPIECPGSVTWASLHETKGNPDDESPGTWANRGFVIREWKARLGGKDARPWIAEHGVDVHKRKQSSTLDIIPPPDVKHLEPGDFVEATIEFIIMPQFAADYYGPNEALREALGHDENTWKMIHREASGGELKVEARKGSLIALYPGVRVSTIDNSAEFTLEGGLGYVPITFTNLASHRGYSLSIDEKPLDQSVHGNDFWQTDYDPKSGGWSQTFNIPATPGKARTIHFGPLD